ncbi:MAG: helix-turn-helix domain-containing protein [Pseudonocardiales bacterium]
MGQLAFGGELRRLREERGLSLKKFGQLVHYDPGYLSKVENGLKPPTGTLATACDEALDAGGELALLAAGYAENRERRLDSGELSTPVEVEKAKRRELVALAAAITFGSRLDEPVKRILNAADEPQVPTRVRVGDVAHLRTAVETLRTQDRRAGGGAVRHQAVAALRWASALLDSSCTPEVRQELAATTADLANCAAWANFDAGRHEPARKLSLLGLWAARESGNLGIRANVASSLARQEIYIGNWAGGLELTQLAFTAHNALTPNEIADLHTVNALAYARKRDIANCLQYTGNALDTYRPDSISNDPPWLDYFTPAQLERDLAFARYDLLLGGADVGDRAAHRLALIECFSTAFRQYPVDRVRSKAIIAAKLATLLYREGEQRLAHQMSENAITLAGEVRSTRLANDLRVLLRALPPADHSNEYNRDLRQRLSVVLIDMTWAPDSTDGEPKELRRRHCAAYRDHRAHESDCGHREDCV